MPEKIADVERPRGVIRLLARAPLGLYRARLGWLLGGRFLKLTHTGRRSGKARTAVLEVVRHDPVQDVYVVASGWGERSDWFRNIQLNPRVTVDVGRRRFQGLAARLSPAEAEEHILDYARRHPRALRALARILGYQLENTEEDLRAFGRLIPLIALKPEA